MNSWSPSIDIVFYCAPLCSEYFTTVTYIDIHKEMLSLLYTWPLFPAGYLVEWWHHRLRHWLWWLWLHYVSGGAARHAQAASLHQATSEQVLLRPGGTKPHAHKSVPRNDYLHWGGLIFCGRVFACLTICRIRQKYTDQFDWNLLENG